MPLRSACRRRNEFNSVNRFRRRIFLTWPIVFRYRQWFHHQAGMSSPMIVDYLHHIHLHCAIELLGKALERKLRYRSEKIDSLSSYRMPVDSLRHRIWTDAVWISIVRQVSIQCRSSRRRVSVVDERTSPRMFVNDPEDIQSEFDQRASMEDCEGSGRWSDPNCGMFHSREPIDQKEEMHERIDQTTYNQTERMSSNNFILEFDFFDVFSGKFRSESLDDQERRSIWKTVHQVTYFFIALLILDLFHLALVQFHETSNLFHFLLLWLNEKTNGQVDD